MESRARRLFETSGLSAMDTNCTCREHKLYLTDQFCLFSRMICITGMGCIHCDWDGEILAGEILAWFIMEVRMLNSIIPLFRFQAELKITING